MEPILLPDLTAAVHRDPRIRAVARAAAGMGAPLYLVGGWIRDRLRGDSSRDYDFLFAGDPGELVRRVAGSWQTPSFVMGREDPPHHRIVGDGFTVDIAPLRSGALARDLKRRDFTINAMAYALSEDRLYDPCGGLGDLQEKTLRMVAPSAMEADPLRMLRAVRLGTLLQGFRLSEETASAIAARAPRVTEAAGERIREEMDRILMSGRGGEGLALMGALGLTEALFPELQGLAGLEQGPYHHVDALGHTLETLGRVDRCEELASCFRYNWALDAEDRLVLGYAALLHDIGKARSLSRDSAGIPHFYGHEKAGAESAGDVMGRLRFSRRRLSRVQSLIRHHVLGLGLIQGGYTVRALRRILRRLGPDLPLHVLLSLADRRAARGLRFPEMEEKTRTLGQALLDLYEKEGRGILHPPKLVSGRDVLEVLGLPQGPAVGEVLERVRSLQTDGVIRTRDQALEFLHRLQGERGGSQGLP